jgi:murein DD-endopeptidase
MSNLVCEATPESLQAEFCSIVEDLLDSASPVDYVWGGYVSPDLGLDCSGLVCWACHQLSIALPLGRPNTDVLWTRCVAVPDGEQRPGDLAIYGKGLITDPASHVMVLISGGRVAGMSGGDHTCTTKSLARAKVPPARLLAKPTHLYRKDFEGWRRLPFHLTPGLQA